MELRTGFFDRIRTRLFGETDPVERQLREISRQGSGMSRIAHACAFALVLLFSLGSLVALGGDALQRIVTGWQRGQIDVPSGISLAVSTLLVMAMDIGMIYAASVIRRLAARRSDPAEMNAHKVIMAIVVVLEACTYGYMAVHYENPGNAFAWGLILARAAAAPVLSVYLSMARPIPVSSRDIMYEVELITGMGVLRHVTELANNPATSLDDLLLMFNAAGQASESDQERLQKLIRVAQRGLGLSGSLAAVSGPEGGPTYPTGGGSPVQVVEDLGTEEDQGKVVALQRIVEQSAGVPQRPAAEAAPGSRRPGPRYPSPEIERRVGYALLDDAGWDDDLDQPAMAKAEFRRQLGINGGRANALWVQYAIEHKAKRRLVTPITVEDVAQ